MLQQPNTEGRCYQVQKNLFFQEAKKNSESQQFGQIYIETKNLQQSR